MADNLYVNKVEYAGETIMDISGDMVTPSDVLTGVTFHDRSGAPQTGNLITHNVYDGLDSTSASDALSAKQGKNLNDKMFAPGLKVGDTYTTEITFVGVHGFVSGGAKSAFIDVPFPVAGTVTAVTITSMLISLRIAAGGYLGGAENTNVTSMPINTSTWLSNLNRQGILRITVTNNSGWGVANNTPFSGEVKLKFSIT